MKNLNNRHKVKGPRCKVLTFILSPFTFHLLAISFLLAIVTWGLFYAILGEVDIRQQRAVSSYRSPLAAHSSLR